MPDGLDQLAAALGPDGLLTGTAAQEKAHSRWARLGRPTAVARPRTVDEVATVLRLGRQAGLKVVPWGGLTGLVDGAYAEGALALSLERMNAIQSVDTTNSTMTVEAGCVLQTACEAAEAEGLLLPIDLGARGSATIGGAISTNAGGNRVLRWGMMRESVLGLEVVLADGSVVSSLNGLLKNNAGYDLKHLFIGAEGSLGVVTRAVLRLRRRPTSQNTAFLAVDAFAALPQLLARLSRDLGGTLSAFEVIWADCYELLTTPPALSRPVIPYGHAFYVLAETMGSEQSEDETRFEAVLGDALAAGEITDAVLAKSGSERDAMWGLRDDVSQTARNGPIIAFDVSLRISDMENYVAQVRQALTARWPGATLMVFGHLGDGNLHLIAGVGSRAPEVRHAVESIVYGPLEAVGGSISAEHGVGLQKREFLSVSRSPAEIDLMRRLKQALDPEQLLNPGKIFGSIQP